MDIDGPPGNCNHDGVSKMRRNQSCFPGFLAKRISAESKEIPPMNSELILTIDVGTQSIRALVFDLRGNLLEKVATPIEPYFSEKPGWAEQDPDYYWENIGLTVRKLWQKNPRVKTAVAGVTITTQRASVVNVDRQGRPLRPAILYLDQRTTADIPPVKGPYGVLFKSLRLGDMLKYLQSQAEVNWIRAHQPEIWKATYRYLFLSGYLNFRLTGNFSDSVGSQVGYVPFDYRRQTWSRSLNWKWQALGMDRDKLPELVPTGGILGKVSAKAAEESGIPFGLPVVASAADKACEVLGCGCVTPEIGSISYGTATTINATSTRYLEPITLIPSYPSALPGHYNMEILLNRGFWLVSWFIKEFGHLERQMAEAEGVPPEVICDRLIAGIPPGSMGLTVQPYWSPGLRMPGTEAKGAIIGFGDVHTRGHLYRAILEGLGYALREGRERIESKTKAPMKELRVSGGGSQSRQVLQITADIFNLPVVRPSTFETAGLGAAVVASVGLGLHKDFDAAIADMIRTGETVAPRLENARLYDQLYRQVYRKIYPRVRPLYKAIRSITGYPLAPGSGTDSPAL